MRRDPGDWTVVTVTVAFLIIIVVAVVIRAKAHTVSELEAWTAEWTAQADEALNSKLMAALEDMEARHPWYYNPQDAPGVPQTTQGSTGTTNWVVGAGVEQWRALVAVYFNASDVNHALCVITHESKGNPNADNPRSSAAGLFQFLRGTWNSVPVSITGGSYDSGRVYNPEAATAAAAYLVYKAGGWGHWTVNPLC